MVSSESYGNEVVMWKLVQNKVSITFFSIKIYAKFLRKKMPVFLFYRLSFVVMDINPSTSKSDQYKISPYNINAISTDK